MSEPYVGQISAFAFPFAPIYWAFCDGSTVPFNQNQVLFSLIGTTFGGDGFSKVGLPQLGGASPCSVGTGPGMTPRALGDSFGAKGVTIDMTTMPPHTHGGQALVAGRGATRTEGPKIASGITEALGVALYSDGAANTTMAANICTPSGGNGAHNNMQPYLALNYCIALRGEYPEFG